MGKIQKPHADGRGKTLKTIQRQRFVKMGIIWFDHLVRITLKLILERREAS